MLDDKLAAIEASGADVVCACDSSCLMHIGGGLRRRGSRRSRRSISRRSSRRERRCRPRRAAEAVPAGGDRRARERAAARRTSATPRRRSARKRAAVVAEVPDWEELREPAPRSRTTRSHASTRCSSSWRPRSGRRAASCTGRATRLRRTRSSSTSSGPTGADEVVKVKSLATDEIRLNEALEAAGIRPIETDLAELIVQLAGERPSHLLVPGDPQEPDRDPRPVPRAARTCPGLSDEPAELAEAARAPPPRGVPARARRDLGRELRRRRDGTICVVESEGNGRMCTTLPEVLITVMGIEKAIPRFRDLEVLPAAPAPLGDRRAHEPVHVALDRRQAGGRAANVPPRAARRGRTRVARRPGRPAGAALHSLLARASTSALSTARPEGTPTTRSYAGPIGAILAPQLSRRERSRRRRFPSPPRCAARATTCAPC